MQQNESTAPGTEDGRPAARRGPDRMHEALESVERIRRQAVTQRIHDLQASTGKR